MAVGLLIITHDDVGKGLLSAAHIALADSPLRTGTLSASRDCDPDELFRQARTLMAQLDSGDGVLVLTDLYGATPSNVATRLLDSGRVRVISGINLPMLIRVFNYSSLDLESLAEKALSGGIDGILALPKTAPGE